MKHFQRSALLVLLAALLFLYGCSPQLPPGDPSALAGRQTPRTAEPAPTLSPAPQTAEPVSSPTAAPTARPSPVPSPAPPALQPEESNSSIAFSTQMRYAELVGDNGDYSKVSSWPPAGTYSIEIDLTNRVMTVFDSAGTPVRQMLCTIGRWDTPTPQGTFLMGGQRERFGYFEKFECYAQYWSQIDGDIFIHSVLYREKDADTLIRSSYRNLGRASSHGCVRLTVPDARWIYENVAPGSQVTILKKDKDKALVKSLRLPKAP